MSQAYPETQAPRLTRADGAAVRILIVEDEVLCRQVLEEELAALGAEIVPGTERGEEALALARAHKPDVVVLDIRLKGDLDGIAVAEEITREMEVCVVYLSALLGSEVEARIRDPRTLVRKPVLPHQLAEAIRYVCGLETAAPASVA